MKCKILHETKGRIRVHFCQKRMTLRQADMAEYTLSAVSGVTKVTVFDRTCDVTVHYTCPRKAVIAVLRAFSYNDRTAALVPEQTGRALNRAMSDDGSDTETADSISPSISFSSASTAAGMEGPPFPRLIRQIRSQQ